MLETLEDFWSREFQADVEIVQVGDGFGAKIEGLLVVNAPTLAEVEYGLEEIAKSMNDLELDGF